MNRSKAAIIILFFAIVQTGISQTRDSAFAYYPLKVGNMWEYSYNDLVSSSPLMYYYTEVVIKDTTLQSGKKYFIIIHTNLSNNIATTRLIRVDSLTANVYSGGGQEYLIDSLRSSVGDRFGLYRCSSIAPQTVLGQPRIVKSFAWSVYGRHQLAYGIGKISDYDESSGWPYASTLVYARIDGKEFGTILSVNLKTEMPAQFALEQNYPNPFNPSTTISFSLPSRSFVSLRILDVLGRDVAALMSEDLSAGNYSRQWNAAGLPSGVYFYRLQAGAYTETKRLVLLR